MNKRVSVFAVLLLALPLCTVMFAQATPWDPRNNDKFEKFEVTATFNFIATISGGVHEYIPSFEQVNVLTITVDEVFLTYEITIDGATTYSQGVDFAYEGVAVYTFIKPVFGTSAKIYPSDYQVEVARVTYTYDFSAFPGGLEGTIQMLAVAGPGGFFINSLAGTGDLQNVQIKATSTYSSLGGGILQINHDGLVSGWPE